MPYEDGSLSAEEYLTAARELKEEQEALDARRRQVDGQWALTQKRMRRAEQAASNELAAGLEQAIVGRSTVLTYRDGAPPHVEDAGERLVEGAELVLRNIAKSPLRVCGRRLPHPGLESMTSAMREQQESGAYPTIEAHKAGATPAYELIMHTFGHFRYQRLTREQENAIRYRQTARTVHRGT